MQYRISAISSSGRQAKKRSYSITIVVFYTIAGAAAEDK